MREFGAGEGHDAPAVQRPIAQDRRIRHAVLRDLPQRDPGAEERAHDHAGEDEREDGVVPSPVPVMVEESASPRPLVWTTLAMGAVVAVTMLSLVRFVEGCDILDVIARPRDRRELSVAVRVAAMVFWWECSASWMASSSWVVYSRE